MTVWLFDHFLQEINFQKTFVSYLYWNTEIATTADTFIQSGLKKRKVITDKKEEVKKVI